MQSFFIAMPHELAHSIQRFLFTDWKFTEGNSGTRSKLFRRKAILTVSLVAVHECYGSGARVKYLLLVFTIFEATIQYMEVMN
jgi:hypothetical protein